MPRENNRPAFGIPATHEHRLTSPRRSTSTDMHCTESAGRVSLPESTVQGRRLLIVEDDFFWADELSQTLRRAGASVLGPVATIEAALILLDAQPLPHAALLDIDLRGRRAHAVAEHLLARRIPFLIMTGFDAPFLPENLAAHPRLEKPIAPGTVLTALAALLSDPRRERAED